METCQSGRMYLFAKEAGSSKGPEGSNPSVSAFENNITSMRCGVIFEHRETRKRSFREG